MPEIVIKSANRERTCRLCESKIGFGEDAVVLKDVHVSPKRVNLFFHPECFYKQVRKLDFPVMSVALSTEWNKVDGN